MPPPRSRRGSSRPAPDRRRAPCRSRPGARHARAARRCRGNLPSAPRSPRHVLLPPAQRSCAPRDRRPGRGRTRRSGQSRAHSWPDVGCWDVEPQARIMQAMETRTQAPHVDAAAAHGWQFWIDRGGTFTDVIGLSPQGALQVRKVPSLPSGGARGDPGLNAARALLAPASSAGVTAVKVGTTVATNALLTRSGEPVVLVTSAGFGDALRIGYQNRPDIFARDIVLPKRLYASVIEARERINCGGGGLAPPQ